MPPIVAAAIFIVSSGVFAHGTNNTLKLEAERKCVAAGHVFNVKVPRRINQMAAWTCTRKPSIAK